MAINIKNLEERIQKKAYAVTSNTPTSELGDIVEAALLATNSLREYDSADLLPTATSSNEKLAYIKKDNSIRFNNGTKWDSLVSGAAQAGAAASSTYFGYVAGGDGNFTSNIEKFNMTSDANGVSTGDLIFSVRIAAGGRSSTHGYSFAGLAPGAPASHINPPGIRTNTIQKWPFAADGDATEVGDMLWYGTSGHSNPASSSTHSYGFGGYSEPAAGRLNTIQKWSHSTDGNATDVGDLLVVGFDYGQALYSADYGYTLGGFDYDPSNSPPQTQLNQISKFSFAADGNAADVGDLTTVSYQSNAFQSSTTGYKSGGGGGAPTGGDTIESFPFASDANATDTADNATSATDFTRTGHNTDTAGYLAGGREPGLPPSTQYIESEIDKYLFAGGTDMANVADLSLGRSYHSGVNQD